MKRSTNRILSAHVGTLPRPEGFPEVYFGEVANRDEFFRQLPGHIKDVVKKQVDIGLDIINDGEFGKLGGFSNYVGSRLEGMERKEEPAEARNVSARDEVKAAGTRHLEEAGEVLLVARRDVARLGRLLFALHALEA